MRIPWKPVLFVLANSVFVVILALLIPLMWSEYGNDYDLGFAYFAIIPACVFFVAIGVFLFIFGKFYSISLLNKLLPFLSVLPFFLGVKTATLPAISIILAVIIILEIYSTVAVLIRNRGKAASETTIEERPSPTRRSIASFIGWGALGFVLGSLAAFLPVLILVGLLGRFLGDSMSVYFQLFISFAVMGGIAGAILGRVALNNTRKARRLALAGGLGFGLGAVLAYLIAQSTAMGELPGFVFGAIAGAFGGAALGQALGHWEKAVFLGLGGMASFAFAHQILDVLYNGVAFDAWNQFLWLPVEAAVAGVALGATIGYLERSKGQADSPVPVG
jgi:hypothetical protein